MGLTCVYGADWVNGRKISLPLLVSDVDDAFGRVQHPVSRVAGGQYAVEHINTSGDPFQNIFGGAHAHEVAGFVLGKNLRHQFGHGVHFFGGFAHRESTDGIALAPVRGDGFGRNFPQLRVGAALHNREKGLLMTINRFGVVETFNAAFEPAVREAHRFFGILEIAWVGRTLIEGHNNVCPDDALDVHHVFWRKRVFRTINMALKGDTFLFDLPPMGERINLIAAAVGQDRALPSIETVDTARCTKHIQTRAEIEVISIAEADFGVNIVAELVLMYGFDGSRGAYGHENGGIDRAVVGFDLAGAGAGVGIGMEEVEGHYGNGDNTLLSSSAKNQPRLAFFWENAVKSRFF